MSINLFKKSEPPKKSDLKRKLIIEELNQIASEMEKTNLWFQMENNSDLIDACIYQREVLNARYRYLLSQIKPDKIS